MSGTQPSPEQTAQVEDQFRALMVSREGDRTTVYADSRGLATVGIGHLVVASDHLKLGDTITPDRVNAMFAADGAASLAAAWRQAGQAGITSTAFIPYLASVNFQLGVDWIHKFPNTWQMIVDGRYAEAAAALDDTLWEQQTPVRVRDFQTALRALPAKQATV